VPPIPTAQIDFRSASISPAEAVSLVASREQDTAPLHRLALVSVQDRPHYRIDVRGGQSYLIDATTGERLKITPELAEKFARQRFSDTLPIRRVVEVSHHSLGYAHGPLPAYRVEFADAQGTQAYVSIRDGSVVHTTRRARIRSFVTNLHTFDQIEILAGSTLAQHASLHVTSIITIVLALTGYYLVLPRGWRRRWEGGRRATP